MRIHQDHRVGHQLRPNTKVYRFVGLALGLDYGEPGEICWRKWWSGKRERMATSHLLPSSTSPVSARQTHSFDFSPLPHSGRYRGVLCVSVGC